eukprot:5249830-Prymnesium_polylepis.1
MGRIPRNVRRGAGKAQTRPAGALAGRELRMNCTSFVGIAVTTIETAWHPPPPPHNHQKAKCAATRASGGGGPAPSCFGPRDA